MSMRDKSDKESISISSLGVLELNLHLTLNQSQISSLGIKSAYINELADLSSLLSMNNTNLLDRIVLMTNNSLINSLLFINRSFKTKTLIELITTNEIYFPPEHLFFKSVLTYVTDKNLLFIFQNKITNIPSSITFTLKIIDDDTEEIEQKFFSIGKQTVPIDKELISCSDNLFDELAYRFSNDYFICSFEDLLQLKQNNNHGELISFFNLLIKNFPTIHIISMFLGEFLSEINEDDIVLDTMKEVIDYSDIVIAEKSIMQSFYKLYGKKYSDKSYLSNCALEEALIQDAFVKKRTEIVKITVLIDKLKTATIVMQEGFSHRVLFNATHIINFNNSNNIDIITNIHLKMLTTVFIGGFLSRLLHFKTFNTCIVAGGKVVSKMINYISSDELESIYDKEAYEVVVHTYHKNKKQKEKESDNKRKKGFVLDCLNYSQSQLKPYNAICDYNCSNFFNSRNKWSFLKHQGFIDKRGALLKDPQLIREPFDKKTNNNNSHSQYEKCIVPKVNIENRMKQDTYYMSRTWKEEPKMKFNKKSENCSSVQLPLMNRTHQSSQKMPSDRNDHLTQRKMIMSSHKSKEQRGPHLEKDKLKEIMLKYENKASDEIRKCNH